MRDHTLSAANRLGAVVAAVAVALAGLTIGGAATAGTGSGTPRPIVFVHGFSGSGAQFETQARRFVRTSIQFSEHLQNAR